jgi:hypothetical protein
MVKVESLFEIFPEQSREAITSLVDDPSFQRQLPKLILDKLNDSPGRIVPVDNDILPLFFTRAPFAETDEAYRISVLFGKYFSDRTRFLPLAVNHLQELDELKARGHLTEKEYCTRGENFASKCLFSLSLFYDALQKLYHKGAPHPGFYREMGKRTFDRIGQADIATHFEDWEEFIREKAFA